MAAGEFANPEEHQGVAVKGRDTDGHAIRNWAGFLETESAD
jgi:hypothetical protein